MTMKRFHNTARQKLIPPVIHHAQPRGRSTDLIGNAWLHAGDFLSASAPPPSLGLVRMRKVIGLNLVTEWDLHVLQPLPI